jgi:hypothetical protein
MRRALMFAGGDSPPGGESPRHLPGYPYEPVAIL